MCAVNKKSFVEFEADAWFRRNKEVFKNFDFRKDPVFEILKDYCPSVKNVLEVGCSFGPKLAGIKEYYPDASVTGVEPSGEAIKFGNGKFPFIEFHQGTADNMHFLENEKYDIVIAGFMLYVVDRDLLLSVVKELDRVLANNGILILIDFFAKRPQRSPYAHINNEKSFTYKLSYENIFTATGMYHLIYKGSFNTSTAVKSGDADFYNKISVTALIKDYTASYE